MSRLSQGPQSRLFGRSIKCHEADAWRDDQCVDGTCTHTQTDPCCNDPDPCCNVHCEDDGNPCTDDACVAGDCQNTPKNCDDGDWCTEDECVAGDCQHTPKDCGDGDPCTTDGCDPGTGACVHTPKVCGDDGNPCTDDRCDAATGDCIHPPKPNGTPCPDDGEVCTDDVCENGECTHPPRGCEDTSNPTAWTYVNFTGIGGCPGNCTPDSSDPVTDHCGNVITVTCQPTPLFGGACAYEFWFNGTRVGACIYTCGLNAFQVKYNNANGCRFVSTRHLTQDQLMPAACDEGTVGKYDWQVYVYDTVLGTAFGYCREGDVVAWEPDEGSPSACEYAWW